jgi:hypothetical protein
MKYATIRIEGAILSADILDRIEQGDLAGQLPKDFGFDPRIKVKDEIVRAWADARTCGASLAPQRKSRRPGLRHHRDPQFLDGSPSGSLRL